MATVVGAGAGLMRCAIQTIGSIFELLGSFKPVTLADLDLDVLVRVENDRCHLVIGSIMTLAAVSKTVAWFGQFADVILDRMSTATTQVTFSSGAGPVALSSCETYAGRRIAVAGIARPTSDNLGNAINMKSLVDKDISITIAGRPDV